MIDSWEHFLNMYETHDKIYFQLTLGASAVRGNKDSTGDPKKKYFVWKTYSDGSKVKEYIDKDQIPDYAISKKGKFDSDDQVNISM